MRARLQGGTLLLSDINPPAVLKVIWASLLIFVAVLAHSQTVLKPTEAAQSHQSIADFGLVYPLSNDWVRATLKWRVS